MTRTFWKRLALAAFVLAEGGAAASAATDVCTDLQARLDVLNRSGSSTQETYRVYDAQLNAQRAALDRATSDARANGCFGVFFSPQPTARCPQLVNNVNTLQGNVNRLTAQRDQYRVDPFTLTSQRNDVLRLLSLNRCGNFAAYNAPPQQPVAGFFASLFGGFGTVGNGYYSDPYAYGNTYRTLCVRTCDGYYFPISFSTTQDRFQADQQACQAACPGTPVSLYVHHNPGEEVDSMVSLAGARYSNLPTAFKYRTSYDGSCSCGAATPSVMDQLAAQAAALTPQNAPYGTLPPVSIPGANATFYPLVPTATAQTVTVPIPSLRPARSEDPETLAGRAGGLVPRPLVDEPGPLVAGVTDDGRPIRVVGPTYYIAQ